MSVLLSTTLISVLRRPADADDVETTVGYVDPYDEQQHPESAAYVVVRSGIRADISSPAGGVVRGPGGTELNADAFLTADPCGLQDEDVILDERTGLRYTMSWYWNYDAPGHFIKSSQAALTRTVIGD